MTSPLTYAPKGTVYKSPEYKPQPRKYAPIPPKTNYNTGVNTTNWTVNPLDIIKNYTNNTYTTNVLDPTLTHNHTHNDWIRNVYTVDFVYDTVHNNYQTNKYDLGQFHLGSHTTNGTTPGVNQYIGNNFGHYGGGYDSGQSYNHGYNSGSGNDLSSLLGNYLNKMGGNYGSPIDAYQKPTYSPPSYNSGSSIQSVMKQVIGMISQLISRL